MDIKTFSMKLLEYIKKYRYVVLVLVLGIALMVFPSRPEETTEYEKPAISKVTFQDPTAELVQILNQIHGVGKVQLVLTLNAGEKTVYQTDQDTSTGDQNSSVRIETVIVSGSDRSENGLVQQILAPEYRGAIVVCQGADNATVRLAIVEAVSDATGLGSDRISVLKMK